MNNEKLKNKKRIKRKLRVRSKVSGTYEKPRLTVFRSNKYFYGQLIDDRTKTTLVHVNDFSDSVGKITKVQRAEKVGEELAKLAMKQKISNVVFDRNGYRYHGRVKAFADGARKGGLIF